MSENLRYIAGHVTLSDQLLEQLTKAAKAFEDIEAGRSDWDPDTVDWDLIEESYEDD